MKVLHYVLRFRSQHSDLSSKISKVETNHGKPPIVMLEQLWGELSSHFKATYGCEVQEYSKPLAK